MNEAIVQVLSSRHMFGRCVNRRARVEIALASALFADIVVVVVVVVVCFNTERNASRKPAALLLLLFF